MNTPSSPLHSRRQHADHRPWWSAPAAFLATVLALPVNAGVTIPDEPMTTGTRIPPNILLVLDNSGSMEFDYMPDAVPALTSGFVSGFGIQMDAYTKNTIFYDPRKDYQPWVNPDGSEMTGGMTYAAAYSDLSRVYPFANGTINLNGFARRFYMPKSPDNPSTFNAVGGYWRYQILSNGTVQRSEWSGANRDIFNPTGWPRTQYVSGPTGTAFQLPAVYVPGNAMVTVTVTNAANVRVYLRKGAAPTTGTNDANNTGTGATKTLNVDMLGGADNWYVMLASRTNNPNVNANVSFSYSLVDGCSNTGWTGCTNVTPTGRTAEAERNNFATWYSYHRTRMKVAKSGAGRAFSRIGTNYRVGFRNIWNDMPTSGTVNAQGLWPQAAWATHPITRAKPIPVTRNGGLFDDPNGMKGADNNKTAWFQRLYAQSGSGGTPLRAALWNAGNYYATDHTETGPWGPGTPVSQFSCRQSYTILTTDGYRNDSDAAGYDYTATGNHTGVPGVIVGEQDGSFPRPYKGDNQADTLADIAMYYWKTDLRADLANNVPASIDDPATHQHMVTFSVSLGAAGSLNPETDLPAITAGTKSWPNSVNNTASSIDDLWHAAVNGRGKYVMANDADRFTKALLDALTEIEKRSSSYSNVASTSVSPEASTLVFNASYEQGSWKGGLRASRASDGAEMWNASVGSWNARNILTSEDGAGRTFPTDNQRAALARTGGTFNYPVTGAKNADYIKGDSSLEGDEAPHLRRRTSVLGDIVNSSPAYDAETNTLYVGANDGMLHAFDATSGEELFAYIPSIINLGLLSTLSRGDYAHRYFVDGPIAVSRRSLTAANENILVGSLGRGGKGLYALDVTNPASMAASNFKWERAETTSNNMGLVLSKPLLANVNNGTRTPAVIVANGPNSTNERAVLIVLDLDTGTVIREIDTGVGSALLPNGLSSATGVYGSDGRTLAYVYAGDMQGNVWKFDLTSATPADWTATRLFTAEDEDGNAQPISGGVAVGVHPLTRKRWVFFGTGRYLTAEDAQPESTDVQSMYGFIDENATRTREDLTERAVQVTEGNVRAFQSRAALPAASKGWYIDLPVSGERIVQDAQLAGRFLVTASIIPAGGACSSSGTGYINALDAFTGTSGSLSYFDLNGDGATEDTAVTGGLPVGSVNLGNGMPTLPNLLRGLLGVGGSGGAGLNTVRTAAPRWDRASWREIRRD